MTQLLRYRTMPRQFNISLLQLQAMEKLLLASP